MGNNRVKCSFDPISETIRNNGSVLFYVSKSKIYNRGFLKKFEKYINLCTEIKGEKIDSYIDQLKEYTGGDTIACIIRRKVDTKIR